MTCMISILASVHVSSFMKNYEELLMLSQDPEKCDRQTDGRTERKPEVPSVETGRGQ